jgi:hypothetical protein
MGQLAGRATRTCSRHFAELRAALVLPGKEMVTLNFDNRATEVLKMMREWVREAKHVAARFASVGEQEHVNVSPLKQAGPTSASSTADDAPASW